MYDSVHKQRKWNITFYDYSSTMMDQELINNYGKVKYLYLHLYIKSLLVETLVVRLMNSKIILDHPMVKLKNLLKFSTFSPHIFSTSYSEANMVLVEEHS